MKKIYNISTVILALFFCGIALGQTVELDRVLIGSASTEYGSDNFYLSASVGEPITRTQDVSDFTITQGFQQSNYVLSQPFVLELSATKAACIGANDGSVSIDFLSDNITPPLTYDWSNGETTPQLTQAEVGSYSVTITGANGNAVVNSITVGAVDSIDCKPGFYTGITPNGDNFNDYWHVDNADFFQEKSVEIFNRYGTSVWNTEAYDNAESAFSGQHRNGNNLPDGTYFYIAKFDESTYRGWIEISR